MAIRDRLENLKPTQLQEINHDVNSYGNFSSAIRESITSLVFIEKLKAFRRLRQERVFNGFFTNFYSWNLSPRLAAWPLRGHTALKLIFWETLFLYQLHDFSLLSLNYFLHQFLKPKFMRKNSLTPRKFHFRRPIFINQNDTLFSKKSNSSIKTILWRKSFETYFDIPKLFWNFRFRYVWRICSWNLFNCIH